MTSIPELIVDPTKRQEFVLLFDVKKGSPNGDPDAANAPRLIPHNGRGLVSDVAIKRKVRDYVVVRQELDPAIQRDDSAPKLDIFIQSDLALNRKKELSAERLVPPLTSEEKKGKRPLLRLGRQMCDDFYDIRLFGAVLATGDKEDRLNGGQVRGPVQITFADSIDPISPYYQTITRNGRTTEKRMETGDTEVGGKWLVLYALYRTHGFVSPFFAAKTGVSATDLKLFWEALVSLFEHDRSASRGEMAVRGLYVFTHDNPLGNAPAHRLFDLVRVERSTDSNAGASPEGFSDYKIVIDYANVPEGVTLTPLVG